MFFVSRQLYWGVESEDSHVVEIATSGIDSSNPDMLVAKYPGEGMDYTNPIEAVEVAIAIAEAWQKDKPNVTINIALGNTHGCTMPFESIDVEELKSWAQTVYNKLPLCDTCGEITEEKYSLQDWPDNKFCSEYCAEKFLEEQTNFAE